MIIAAEPGSFLYRYIVAGTEPTVFDIFIYTLRKFFGNGRKSVLGTVVDDPDFIDTVGM